MSLRPDCETDSAGITLAGRGDGPERMSDEELKERAAPLPGSLFWLYQETKRARKSEAFHGENVRAFEANLKKVTTERDAALDALEEVLSDDPDVPSYQSTLDAAEALLKKAGRR